MLEEKIYQLPTFLHKENYAMSGQQKSYFLVFREIWGFGDY